MGLGDILGSFMNLGGAFVNANQARHNEDFYRSEGDPYRSQLRAMTANPDMYFKGPEAQSLARMLDQHYSSQFGNPSGSGTAMALASDALLRGFNQKQQLLGQLGGVSEINKGIVPGNEAVNKAYQGIFGAGGGFLGSLGGLFGLG